MTRLDPVQDDLLLDRLGRGEPVDDAGDVGVLLAQWRATLPDAAPVDERLLAATTRRAPRPIARLWLGIATGVVLACGGTAVAAAHAGHGSPLWPVTQFLYDESRTPAEAASQGVADARIAAEQGRFDDAIRLLDEAAGHLSKIHEPDEARRLRAQLEAVRALLPHGPFPVRTVPDIPGSVLAPTSGTPQSPVVSTPPAATPTVESPIEPRGVRSTPAPTPSRAPTVPMPTLQVFPEPLQDATPTK